MRTSEQIKAEIEAHFGFFPPFFAPALESPQVMENLWRQTLSAYLNNPLAPFFKEKLNALLSRFCSVPYCMVCHSSALRPLGMSSGEVLALLESPLAPPPAVFGSLPVPSREEAAAPAPNSPLEQTLLACATLIFLDDKEKEPGHRELRRLLGADLYLHLIACLAYIQTCHTWMEAHPEISYEADKRAQDFLGPLLAEEPALADFFAHYPERIARWRSNRDIEAARADERRQAEEALREANQRTANILESTTDAFYAFDSEWRFTYMNAHAERLLQRPRAALLGRNVWEEFPEAAGTRPSTEYRRAVAEQVPVAFEEFYVPLGTWFEVRAYPSPEGLAVYFHDISARKEAEEALRVSESRFRLMADAIPHIAWTTDAGGAIDYYNQRWYDYSGLDFDRTRDWGWQAVIHPDDLAHAGSVWLAALASGGVSEVEYRLRRADGSYRWHLGRTEPVRDAAGRVIQWVGTATDIEERRRAEDERERLLMEAEARAERESLLNRVGVAVRASTDPAAIQQAAAVALGAALKADRCFFAACDEARGLSVVSQEWHLDDLTPLAGACPPADYLPILNLLQSGRTLIVRDVRTESYFAGIAGTMERVGLRAAIRVPLFDDGRLVGLVGVAMAGRPRDWTQDEVTLVETVAAQTRTAAEAARLRLREHNIATQLQEALKPSLPGVVPGLALAKYHKAALAEAEVGGDFYDVFSVEKGCTALVVGDLSGKGLAAAAQVATVRNMLRATLYLGASLAEAVTNLNDMLAENDLLTGFATLFVGTYDSGSGILTYVNCGQEPGLVRRMGQGPGDAGRIEELLPTGPVLGAFAGAVFTDRSVSLRPGDAFAFFTDGLTEAGPDHTDMLGIEGVTALLAAPRPHSSAVSAERRAEDFRLSLIAGVDQYAQSGVRDDVCLLVGVVKG